MALSGFMAIYTSSLLSIKEPIFTASGEVASFFLTMFELLPFLVILGLAVWITIFSTQKQREDPDFKRIWGRLFKPVKNETRLQLAYFFIFIFRRWVII
mmetsp:Transcript_26729/g.40773  ORF Transcript_26729/g.40773 Transcript_26729/m.40773 type:complete len:99 (-) Transcript_26729:982-1278(-)